MLLTQLGFSVNNQGHLALNGVDLVGMIGEGDRPIYVLYEPLIRQHIHAYQDALKISYPKKSTIFYASKVLLNLAMANLIKQEGLGMDVCSEGELFVAQQAEFPSDQILLHGNNKSRKELQIAIESGIYAIVVDSPHELEMIEELLLCHPHESGDPVEAQDFLGSRFRGNDTSLKPSVMLRVNPIINVDTHPYIATGVRGSKFGMSVEDPKTLELLKRMAHNPLLSFKGIHFHIGSQIHDFQAYGDALSSIISYMATLKDHGVHIDVLNMGGGLGVNDTESTTDVIKRFIPYVCGQIINLCAHYDLPLPELVIEPGRTIVSQAGCTLYKVGVIKEVGGVPFVSVHGGMSDNLRPALYKAKYTAVLANKMNYTGPLTRCKVVGNCCETGDVLIDDIELPPCAEGDILVLLNTGAYSYSLANQFNKHTLPGIILMQQDGSYDWMVRPQTMADLIRNDMR